MSRPLRVISFALATLLLLAAVAAFLLSRLDAQSRFIEMATEATGLEVAVDGSVSIGLLPAPHMTLRNVTLKNKTSTIATLSEGDIGVAFWPLLRKQVRPTKLTLRNVSLAVERDGEGRFNFATPARAEQEERPLSRMSLDRVSISNATLIYSNRQLGKEFKATDCNVESDDLQLAEGEVKAIMKHLSLTARVECAEVHNDLFTGSDVKFSATGKQGVFRFTPITMRMMGGKGTGDVDADFNGTVPAYRLRYAVTQLHVDDLFKSLAPSKVGEGFLDFTADLSMRGFDTLELTRSAQGEASLTGKDLQLAIGDLDKKLKRYESSQHFNLVDVGAFFIAGPFGAVVTKGYNFASVFQATEGNTEVRVLVSHWKVENGVAHAQDVAMATKENRMAMKGALDFVNRDFDNVTVAVIDRHGCARAEQKIRGSFDKPDIEQPNILSSLAGPITDLIEKAGEAIGAKCDVFYEGSIPP
jgi:uncharacterized protein involved in outer membrane biogenesis